MVELFNQKENSMNTRRKQKLRELMVAAWNLSRFGAGKFGGQTKSYFWMALRIVWQESREKFVYHTKTGITQAWMGTGIPGGMPDCLLAYRADGCRPDQETDV